MDSLRLNKLTGRIVKVKGEEEPFFCWHRLESTYQKSTQIEVEVAVTTTTTTTSIVAEKNTW